MQLIFWFSLFMIFYAYFGYALVLLTIDTYRRLFRRNAYLKSTRTYAQQPDDELPQVSFIITAYNEAVRIGQKIENSLAQTYPKAKLEIIIASDCSSDATDAIVAGYETRGVKLVRAPERKGKENAQMHAVRAAAGDILVFSDVATILKPDAIQRIVRNFQDPAIGCVSSEDRFIDRDGHVSGEGLYVKYEMFLRALESRVNTLVGLSGSFFAARRDVCQNWAPDLQSDFNTLLNSVKLGFKGISDPHSIGFYENIADEHKEFQRKVRTVLRGITVLMRNLHLLNPSRHGLFAWQLFSHKLCRWMVPSFLVLCIVSNIIVACNSGSLILVLIIQSLFYALAYYYYFTYARNANSNKSTNLSKHKIHRLLEPPSRIIYFIIAVNYSVLVAWGKYFKGERAILWEPSKR